MSLPKINHTQISNKFLDDWMPILNSGAVKCFLKISRQTIGWWKSSDSISVSQLQKGTGLSKQGVIDSLKELEEHGLIVRHRQPRKTTVFEINYETVENGQQDLEGWSSELTRTGQVSRPDGQKSGQLSRHTKEKNLNKGKKNNGKAVTTPDGYKEVVEMYFILHEKKYREKPLFGATEGRMVKDLLKQKSKGEVLSKLEGYYLKDHWFTKNGQRDFKAFRQHFNEVIPSKRSKKYGSIEEELLSNYEV